MCRPHALNHLDNHLSTLSDKGDQNALLGTGFCKSPQTACIRFKETTISSSESLNRVVSLKSIR